MLRIKLVKSPVAHNWRIRQTVKAIGLNKLQQIVEREDNPSVRGQIHAAKAVLLVEDAEGKVLVDGRKDRKFATRKDKKPPEAH